MKDLCNFTCRRINLFLTSHILFGELVAAVLQFLLPYECSAGLVALLDEHADDIHNPQEQPDLAFCNLHLRQRLRHHLQDRDQSTLVGRPLHKEGPQGMSHVCKMNPDLMWSSRLYLYLNKRAIFFPVPLQNKYFTESRFPFRRSNI